MDVQTTFDITPEYQRRAVRAATGRVGFGIALTGGSFLLLAWLLGSYTLAALGAVYLGLGPLIGFKRRRALRRVQGTVLVSLTDADLQLSGAHSASRQDWSTLGSVQQGQAIVLDDETLVSAFSSGSVLGTLYALEKTVPMFAAAV